MVMFQANVFTLKTVTIGRQESHDKCSAVAEMGDRLATTDVGRELGRLCPIGGLGPHVTHCGHGRGLPPYKVASNWANWAIQPFGHNRHGSKSGGCSAPCFFLGGGSWVPIQHGVAGAETYLHAKFHLYPSNVWSQYTNVTDRIGQTTVR